MSTPDLWVPYVAPIHGGIDARVLSVQVVLLQGGDARKSWRRVLRRSPNIANDLTVISTYHPGAQALWHKDLAERIRRVTHQADAYQQLAAALA
ncbi:hypothetical protein E3T35_10000 [Cryobacterium sp. TMT1-2-2]|nr:hypothetical protein E3T35_10000 [Cryobacterium sp. TMT1-2-2]